MNATKLVPVYSQGVCSDGAAILCDGARMTVDEVVRLLNAKAPEQAEGEAVYFVVYGGGDQQETDKAEYEAHKGPKRILFTAAPRVGDVMKAAQDLLDACIAEFGTGDEPIEDDDGPMWGDDSKVSYPEETCNITFGHIRRLKAALENTNAS